jgi:hypothetical protein
MKLLIISNILLWIMIIVLLRIIFKDYFPLVQIKIRKTFWEKRPYGIEIWIRTHINCMIGRGFNWKDLEKIPDRIEHKKRK